ncbi:sensor domain-containing diguanylate cyclase [Stieleria varia]|uniref:diguanylate cyclase n=1 Tax=Stieleria varia TaxID=2528005 RepID=A0A5C6ARQ4_9BACT|nr:GGDEF domain-containing protein [Stieleria varia]TWU02181.1 Diguanylate cyclase DosC [Stieleria varia]
MNQYVQEILQNDRIPSPPSVAIRLLDLVSQPDVNVDELTKVLSADPRLSARLIAYCNSPMVGSKRKIASVPQAVMVLGLRTLRLLSLSFSLMDTQSKSDFDFDDFWRSSLATAVAAKCLGRRSGQSGDEEFLLGLVLNIGMVGMGVTSPQKLTELLADGKAMSEITIEMENSVFGTNRFEVGGKLLEKWNFPSAMAQTIGDFNPEQLNPESTRLALGQTLAALLLSTDVSEAQLAQAKTDALTLAQIDDVGFRELFDEMVAQWTGYESLFNFDSIAYGSLQELEERAKDSMMKISLGMDSEIQRMTIERKELEERVMIDVLTNLKNRAAYNIEVSAAFEHHRRNQMSIGVVVIDIDHFKSVNDTYGHAAGDDVLRAVGRCLATNCRKGDSVYRYGGEEFVAVIHNCEFNSIKAVANRFLTAIQDLQIETDVHSLKITASSGACWADKANVQSVETLFNHADKLLYKAKVNGRNQMFIDDVTTLSAAT